MPGRGGRVQPVPAHGATPWQGASYPPITVTVNVAGNATSPQVNAVRLSFGISGSANTTDSTIINSSALTVTCSAPLSGTVGTPYFWSTCTPSGALLLTPELERDDTAGLSINSSQRSSQWTPTRPGLIWSQSR